MEKKLTITKAVFPVAGLGTRFLPATKANPKEMMPVVDKPLIQYAVEEAMAAGITDLIFVTSSSKRAIEDHFDNNYELECKLKERNETALLEILDKILPPGVTCTYVRQPLALGLGHAILCAKKVVGQEAFAVLLADDLIAGSSKKESLFRGCLSQLVQQYEATQSSVIGIEKINVQHSEHYGMVGFNHFFDGFGKINTIVEKPSPHQSPSSYAVVGRYILTPTIFSLLERLTPGKNNEIQLTDAIAGLLSLEPVHALEFLGKRYDCGTKLGYLQAIVALGLAHPEVGPAFNEYLRSLHKENA